MSIAPYVRGASILVVIGSALKYGVGPQVWNVCQYFRPPVVFVFDNGRYTETPACQALLFRITTTCPGDLMMLSGIELAMTACSWLAADGEPYEA